MRSEREPRVSIQRRMVRRLAPIAVAAIAMFSSNPHLPDIFTDPTSPSISQNLEKQEQQIFAPQVTIVDFAPSTPEEGIIQKEFVPMRRLIENVWTTTDNDTKKFVTQLAEYYSDHGQIVAKAMEKAWGKMGLQSSGIKMIPLQSIFDSQSWHEIKDPDTNNPGISLNFDPKHIIKLLENDDSRIVNMSFQVGNVDIFPKKIIGAYHHSRAEENLSKLFEVANAYPDKLFIAAAGNNNEDLRDALKALKDKKPNNLLLTAQWKQWQLEQHPEDNVYAGADITIYTDNALIETDDGSSISSSIVTAAAEALFFRQGLTMEQVIAKIKSVSIVSEYEIDGVKEKALVFDPKNLLPLTTP